MAWPDFVIHQDAVRHIHNDELYMSFPLKTKPEHM